MLINVTYQRPDYTRKTKELYQRVQERKAVYNEALDTKVQTLTELESFNKLPGKDKDIVYLAWAATMADCSDLDQTL